MNKKMKYGLIILGIIILLYFFIFVIVRPFGGMIVEDKPLLSLYCEMQYNCHIGNSSAYQCGYSESTPNHYKTNLLSKISNNPWYKGCNESTPGFFIGEMGMKFVSGIKACSCGGIQ